MKTAEQTLKDLEAMVAVARKAFQSKHDGEDASRIVAIAFYDAGYRKMEDATK